MKIAFVAPNYYPTFIGGAELSLKLLAEHLVKCGHLVIVLSFDNSSNRPVTEIINGVRIVRYKLFSKSAMPLGLALPVLTVMKLWAKFVDIFHLYNVMPLVGGALYRTIWDSKKPIVATLNNFSLICSNGSLICDGNLCNSRNRYFCLHYGHRKKALFSILYSAIFPILTRISQNLECYIALSASVKQYYVLRGFDPAQIVVIPNFHERFDECSILKCSKNENSTRTFNILYVGAMTEEKGVGLLIKAFSIISDKHKKARLILVGFGRRFDNYLKQVQLLSLTDKVIFKGAVFDRTEIAAIFSDASVFVHPALAPDAFGRTILEAINFGVPAVVSDIGAPPEIIGSAGLVFRRGDVNDLVKKIETVMQNEATRLRLIAGSRDMMTKYDPDTIVSQVMSLYADVLSRNKR